MRKIIVVSFLTMDGVLQAPGGPEEDRTGGFKWGGWQFNYGDDEVNKELGKIFVNEFDLLLGRRTYEIFAAYWPYMDDEIGRKFNSINKYVVATTPIDTSWHKTILINKDVVNELKKLKAQDGPDLLVHGSSVLIQTLLANRLVDILHTWTYPITLGKGKKLFQDGTQPQEWRMTEGMVSPSGVVVAKYEQGGDVRPGSYAGDQTSKAELARRKKMVSRRTRQKNIGNFIPCPGCFIEKK
jgi:dihydrofolate reductase